MNTIKTGKEWLDRLMPEGLPANTSTIISGPGGSGKPLIGESFVAAWLKEGGNVIFMSLQYPTTDFLVESIKNVTGINLDDYYNKIIIIELDVTGNSWKFESENKIKANLVKPSVWEEALKAAKEKLPEEGRGNLVFGSALNLLLFSPTYGSAILNKIIETITFDKSTTYIFSVSTTVKAEEIKMLENAADNLIYAHSEKEPFRLFMNIERLINVKFDSRQIQVPIPSETLTNLKETADHSRKVVIPAVSKI
ncbi:MAG: hypothetical protein JW995_05555 [Melioribacteraceae bacterium]|nr:hypothetical protein [Melioribacteraceae bacterium]